MMHDVNTAKEILLNPEKRRKYDAGQDADEIEQGVWKVLSQKTQ